MAIEKSDAQVEGLTAAASLVEKAKVLAVT